MDCFCSSPYSAAGGLFSNGPYNRTRPRLDQTNLTGHKYRPSTPPTLSANHFHLSPCPQNGRPLSNHTLTLVPQSFVAKWSFGTVSLPPAAGVLVCKRILVMGYLSLHIRRHWPRPIWLAHVVRHIWPGHGLETRSLLRNWPLALIRGAHRSMGSCLGDEGALLPGPLAWRRGP